MSKDMLRLALANPKLASKKLAYARKKRAAMIKEAPYKKEFSLTKNTKQANLSRKLTDMAYRSGLKAPSFSTQASYGLLRGTPEIGGTVAGGVGGHLLARELAPHIGVKGFYEAQTLPEILAGLGLSAAGTLGGVELFSRLGKSVGKGISKKLMPETARYMRIADPYKLASFTKKANLSRATKGAIGLPAAALALGPLAAATNMPYVADDMVKQLAGGIGKLDDVPGSLKALYGPLKLPALFEREGQVLSGNVFPEKALAGLGGLSAIGAGAGKLSEKLVPVSKKRFIEDPKTRKMLLAASLFPWVSTTLGASYLLNKARNSDS